MKVITSDQIKELTPRSLITNAITGMKTRWGTSIEVILDTENKLWFTDAGPQDLIPSKSAHRSSKSPILLQSIDCKLSQFGRAKQGASSNPDFQGGAYECSPCNLSHSFVPIVEKEGCTFIGVILSNNRLPSHFKKNKSKISSSILIRKVLNVTRLNSLSIKRSLKAKLQAMEDLENRKSEIREFATEIAQPFKASVLYKRLEFFTKTSEEATSKVYKLLSESEDLKAFQGNMRGIIEVLQEWLRFDWCMVLQRTSSEGDDEKFELLSSFGRGLPQDLNKRVSQIAFPSGLVRKMKKPHDDHDSPLNELGAIVSESAEYWWIPMMSEEGTLLGGIALGSTPEHRNEQYDRQLIEDRLPRVKALVQGIVTQYANLIALESLKQETIELEGRRRKVDVDKRSLEDAIIKLTHQLKRPLLMVQAVLSNYREEYRGIPGDDLDQELSAGISLARNAELLCQGISKSLAIADGHTVGFDFDSINVKSEIQMLCDSMKRASGNTNLRFEFFNESPIIRMDKDSFLYVLYVLIDNAIKYSDPGSTISLGCAEERRTGLHAIKVKSLGLPLTPGLEHRVFEKFWRGSAAHKRDETGIGIGCWAAKQHMELQGGDLTVEADGKLTVFVVYPPSEIKR